jgi:hypothetical protein
MGEAAPATIFDEVLPCGLPRWKIGIEKYSHLIASELI